MPDRSDLQKAGLKVTTPRLKVLEVLTSQQERHWSAEALYQALRDTGEDIALATVYRVLTQFEAAGLVVKHHFDEAHSVYELDHGEHHDHIVCVSCGAVKEFVDPVIEDRQEAIAQQHGYQITDHSLTIYGLCQPCQRKATA